jgi:hypothetical protein
MPMKARPPSRKSEKRDLSMPDRQILVSGANRGIGAAIATELAAAGLCVVGLTRSGTSAAGTAVACDVGDDGAIARAIGRVAEQGSIAGLVNNAGLYEAHRSAELAAADFERIMRINATSMVVAARCVYPHLQRAGGGLIVNIGSYYDKLGVAKTVAYCASKAAVGAITRCLAVVPTTSASSTWHRATLPPNSMPSSGHAMPPSAGSSSAFPPVGPARRLRSASWWRCCLPRTSPISPARQSMSTVAWG